MAVPPSTRPIRVAPPVAARARVALGPPPAASFGAIRKALAAAPAKGEVTRDAPARPRPAASDDERLDACARILSGLAPPAPRASDGPSPGPSPAPIPSATAASAPGSASGGAPLADALERARDLLDRVALWSDGHAGLARLRFDARARGGLAAAAVTLEHRDGVLRIGGDGVDEATLAALRERLRARGLVVDD